MIAQKQKARKELMYDKNNAIADGCGEEALSVQQQFMIPQRKDRSRYHVFKIIN